MRKINLGILIMMLLVVKVVSSQNTEWIQRYNSPGNNNDYVWDMVVDYAGNVYLTGYIFYSNPNQDFLTIKYNTLGVVQWVKTYDGSYRGSDMASTIRLDKQGNVYVLGISQNIYGKSVYAVIKYSNFGEQLWVREYINEDSSVATPNALAVDDSSNVIVTGYCTTSQTGGDFTTVKYNSDGIFQWVRYYSGTENVADIPYAIATDKQCNIYVTGVVRDSVSDYNMATVKYDKSGIQKWAVKYLGVNNNDVDEGRKILVDKNGFIWVGGITNTGFTNEYDIFVINYDSSGNEKWNRTYGSIGASNPNDYLRDMTIDDSSNIYVCGVSDSIWTGWDYTTLKYNNSGDWLWVKRYNNGNSEVNSIATDRFNNVYITGKTDSNFLSYRFKTIKYSTTGNLLWMQTYNNGSPYLNHTGARVKTDSLGNAYVTGNSEGSGTGMDIATIKYSIPTYIDKPSNEIPTEFKLFQNYPNPFNSSTIIRYQLPESGYVVLKIYDLLGREIQTLVNENQKPGVYEARFYEKKLSSGIYFYNIFINGVLFGTKKLVLIN